MEHIIVNVTYNFIPYDYKFRYPNCLYSLLVILGISNYLSTQKNRSFLVFKRVKIANSYEVRRAAKVLSISKAPLKFGREKP